MAAALNLYLDSQLSYIWKQASMIVAKSQDHGNAGFINSCIMINSQSIAKIQHSLEIQIQLAEHSKTAYIKAQDVGNLNGR